jgi:hypothetical protein
MTRFITIPNTNRTIATLPRIQYCDTFLTQLRGFTFRARLKRDEEDLFMLLVFAETLGVPNPASWYTMEMMPVLYEQFHDWHRRMGMEHSPLDHLRCC